MDLSTYLNGLLLAHPEWLERLFVESAQARLSDILRELAQPLAADAGEKGEMAAMRLAKSEFSLLVALLDLFGVEDEDYVTRHLSALAEGCTSRALRFCLTDLHRRGQLQLPDPDKPELGCGLFVLGMGKLGGRELNYSSDIDLILLFDPDVPAIVDPPECVEMFSRLARRMVRMLSLIHI